MNKLEIKQPVSEVVIAENQQKIAKYLEDNKPVTLDELEELYIDDTIYDATHVDFENETVLLGSDGSIYIKEDVLNTSIPDMVSGCKLYINGELLATYYKDYSSSSHHGSGYYGMYLYNDDVSLLFDAIENHSDDVVIKFTGLLGGQAYYTVDKDLQKKIVKNGLRAAVYLPDNGKFLYILTDMRPFIVSIPMGEENLSMIAGGIAEENSILYMIMDRNLYEYIKLIFGDIFPFDQHPNVDSVLLTMSSNNIKVITQDEFIKLGGL